MLEHSMNNPIYDIFLKSCGFKDVKYDIPMCHVLIPFNSAPHRKKALYVIISSKISVFEVIVNFLNCLFRHLQIPFELQLYYLHV